MEPVKTCVTCKHSLVARLHPADWFKRRLCGHPGMVDRVEGKPLNACDEARQAEQPCGIKGGLWDGPSLMDVKPTKLIVRGDMLEDARKLMDAAALGDPIDLAMRFRPRGRHE